MCRNFCVPPHSACPAQRMVPFAGGFYLVGNGLCRETFYLAVGSVMKDDSSQARIKKIDSKIHKSHCKYKISTIHHT